MTYAKLQSIKNAAKDSVSEIHANIPSYPGAMAVWLQENTAMIMLQDSIYRIASYMEDMEEIDYVEYLTSTMISTAKVNTSTNQVANIAEGKKLEALAYILGKLK